MNLFIRPAQREDVEVAIPLIYQSGPHELDYGFQVGAKTTHEFVRKCFLSDKGIFSWKIHRVAEVNGRVVGIGAFFSGANYGKYSNRLMIEIFKFYPLTKIAGVLLRLLHLTSIMPAMGKDVWFLTDFAVHSSTQSLGIGRAMLEEQIAFARKHGYRYFGLDVAADNPRARALYERMGLRVVKENVFKGPKGKLANGLRMLLELR